MLSDRSIRRYLSCGDLDIKPFPAEVQFQPVSVDLLLGSAKDAAWWINDEGKKNYVIPSFEFVLASTCETITLGRNIAGTVHGKSTWARRGLQVHAAGLVDPGFTGELTLELFNMSRRDLLLSEGEAIAQISFCLLSSTPDRAYGEEGLNSHYQGQTGPTPAAPQVPLL